MKRVLSRVDFNIKAVLSSENDKIEGEVQNLSLNGMFLITEKEVKENVLYNIEISLQSSSSDIKILIKGLSVRKDDAGHAFTFSEIDLDSFIALKNVIAYNSGSMDKIENEFKDFIDQKKAD